MTALPRVWIAGVIWLLSSFAAQAQHWSFQKYGNETGLTNPTILALHQDRQGFLWVSTEGGLFRYDGDRFRVFEAHVPGKAADITSLHTSADGQLWAGSSDGLFHWSGDRFLAVPGSADLELESGQAIASDSEQLYVASTSGLWSLPLATAARPKQLTAQPAASVFVGKDQTIWFGCGSSLCTLRNGHETKWNRGNNLVSGPWNSIVEDSIGKLWIRSAEQVFVRDSVDGSFRRIASLNSTHRVTLVPDRHGQMMIPYSGGLAICGAKGCRQYGVESGLEHAEPLVVSEDREGSLWIGYSGRGLARWLGREEWQSFAELEGISDPQIWRIVRDVSGTLWIGTNRGLFSGSEQGGRWHFRRSSVLSDWTVYGLLADPSGALWLGTFQSGLKGLVRYEPRTGQTTIYPPAQAMPQLSIVGLARDPAGTLWVATSKQVLRLSPNSKRLERVDLPVSGSSLHSILYAAGTLYVSGRKGLYVERGGMRRLLTSKDGLQATDVQSVTVGPSGELWITYFGPVGLSRLDWMGDQFHFQHFTTADGLTSSLIYSQFFDFRGRHWIGTDSGVAVLQANRWMQYDTSDGLVSNDCNAQAYYADPDGSVWIGTSAGLSRYSPTRQVVPPIPSALITAVMRNEEVVTADAFDSGTRTLAFHFTMPSYRQQNPRFRYRLGSANPWIETRAREVHFAELPPGPYHFEVQGNVGGNTWSHPAGRDFNLSPPWFRSRTFLAGSMSMLAGLIWFAWRRRERNEQRLRASLEAAVAERTSSLAAATARAEKESRFKGDFLANMSHEMRTPLNGVLGLTKLALGLSNQPEVVGHLATVEFSAKVLLSLINDVLDLAKIEAGMLEIVPVPFAPRLLLDEVRSMMQTEAWNKGLLLETSIESAVPEWVKADDCRLRQVLVNLVGNAIKFTQSGSVKIAVRYDGAHLHCTVTDTGIGISRAQQAMIFDMFRQADSSISRRYGGTGLGLAISRKLTESMGGLITVDSELNRGSTFSFGIAAPEAVAPVIQLAPSQEVPGRPLRILVAEDNKVNQHLLLALLCKRGHSPVVANNGREALDAYAREYFDLILMDVQMPEMDGLEAVRRIREKEVLTRTRIPVIAVTARAMLGDRDHILAAGMDDYLEKPIRTEQLEAVLSRFAHTRTPLPEAEDRLEKFRSNTEFAVR